MTRENKLALIIGFTLILMVGVLVSDHLSRAREAQLDAATGPATSDVSQPRAFSGSLLTEAIDAAQDRAAQADPPVATRLSPGAPAAAEPEPTIPPAVIRQGQDAAPSASLSLNSGMEQLNGVTDRVLGRLEESARRPMFEETPVPRIQSPTRSVAVPRDAGPAPTYAVRENDSLYKIADRVLGDGNRWREIQRLNADRVPENGSVRVGQVLRLPGAAAASSTPAETTPAAGGTYTVQRGDTLGEIASKTMGSSRHTDAIVRANRDQISDPDEIRVGMVLKIPAR